MTVTLLDADFTTGAEGFVYVDDAFGGSAGAYASGSAAGGQLQVLLGGIDGADILDMSGGWQRSFTLDEA